MRALVIDDAAKAEVKRVVDHAIKPENLYDLTKKEKALKFPGDNPQHVAQLNSFRCVFTITKGNDGTFRHLSISVPHAHYANPIAAFTIAEMFGFTGWNHTSQFMPEEWSGAVNENEHCIVLAQKL